MRIQKSKEGLHKDVCHNFLNSRSLNSRNSINEFKDYKIITKTVTLTAKTLYEITNKFYQSINKWKKMKDEKSFVSPFPIFIPRRKKKQKHALFDLLHLQNSFLFWIKTALTRSGNPGAEREGRDGCRSRKRKKWVIFWGSRGWTIEKRKKKWGHDKSRMTFWFPSSCVNPPWGV